MQTKKIANTDLELSAITFGAWAAGGWMWGGTEEKDAIGAIFASYEMGVTSIDTAPIYGQGQSEEIVAKAISDLPRDKIQILTKYGLSWEGTEGEFHFASKDNEGNDISIYKNARKESIIKECEDSLRRLNTDYIDLYQIHWPDATTPINETMEAVDQLLQSGKIRFAGVCNYSVEQVMEANNVIPIVSDQVPYSMLRRDIEKDLVPYCIQTNKAILAYSPLERGLLTGKITDDYEFKDGDHRASLPYYKRENILKVNEFLNTVRTIADIKGYSIAQVVLNWTLNQPGITIALVGARNAKQAIENAKALDFELSEKQMFSISKRLEEISLA